MDYGSKRKKVKSFGSRTGLSRGDNSRDENTKLTDEEIQEAADKAADAYEKKSGKKANRYTHKSETAAQKFNREQDEKKAKKKDNGDKGWFSKLADKVKGK